MFKTISRLSVKDREKYGVKASVLGELEANGFNVPDGFAVSNEVFIKYMKYNSIPFTIDECLSRNEKMREQIINGKFPIDIENELEELFNNINQDELDAKYVVRSSAVREDNKEHSMAGMFSSFIKLSSFEEVLKFIKECYASVFDDKVIEYIVNNDLGIEALKMGVVIQEFIIGDYSGVNFSVDTIDMNEEYMHVNVVSGICDDFVSGKRVSSFYSICKKDGMVVESKIQDNHKILLSEYIENLHKITLNIEKLMNEKVDIEWTINGNLIYILQARPITTFKTKEFPIRWDRAEDINYTWYCDFHEPWFPLICDIAQKEQQALNKSAYEAGDENWYPDFIVQNGYTYYRNMEMPNHEKQKKKFQAELNQITKEGKNIFEHIILPKLIKMANELDVYAAEENSPKRVSEFLEKSLKYMEFTAENHTKAMYSCEYVKEFEKYCKGIIEELSQQDFYDLIFNKSILNKEREYYVKIAKIIKSNDETKSLFEKSDYYKIIYEHLKTIPEAEEFFMVMDDYIKEYGSTHLDCDVISSHVEPTILECPARVLKYIKGFIGIEPSTYFNSMKKSKQNKERVKALFLSKLNKEQSEEFLMRLKLAEVAYLARDNHHYYFERKTGAYLSLAINAASKILKNNKVIIKKEDICFLKFDEIKKGLLCNIELASLAQERRAEYEKQKKLLPPEYIGKAPVKKAETKKEACNKDIFLDRHNSIVLKGLSGLRKKAKGKVCIGIPTSINKGSILVIPFTRCGDIFPILDKVAGIIVEQGSPFEHLGIILREQNIPCLYNVKDACTLLKYGDEVKLDGIKGEVVKI
jgi:pyruvate,water dikinase